MINRETIAIAMYFELLLFDVGVIVQDIQQVPVAMCIDVCHFSIFQKQTCLVHESAVGEKKECGEQVNHITSLAPVLF